ncbi:E3 ubiquitin-protein ligase RNF135-like isoform X2 [Sceloporus undulatus]|uniref:E3 ubiquitin-protein ligase RNF135-like isoform X2 n=1 Tax=Sceloporus undulatus TaxID=8520 RepID=UPI001C4C898C|nr:E3 ubiquitin-protein ligase RNF135-like isoform X2 [Sceloporus undulatus]
MATVAAALRLEKELQEELTCCVCLDFFNNPVLTVGCSHNFCRGCISQHCQKMKTQASCPKCRGKLDPKRLVDNRCLANIVEIFQKVKKAPGAWPRKSAHWREDPEGPGPDGHPPHLLKDVVKITELPQQIERALETIANWRKDSTELMDYVSCVKNSIAEAFHIVKTHLSDQEKMVLNVIDKEYVAAKQKRDTMNEQLTVRLDQLLELQKEVIKNTSLEEEVCIGDPIKENEVTLSVHKISSIACTVEEFKRNLVKLVVENFPAQRPIEPTPGTSEIQMDVAEDEAASSSGSSSSQNSSLETSHSSSTVSSPIDRTVPNVSSQLSQWATDVTFDFKRINHSLELSEDKRRVVVSRFPPKYDYSANRFRISQVMGSPGFSEGCHYWQVSTKDATGWAIGLAHEEIESTDKLGRTGLSWCIEWSDGRLSAWHGNQETHISQEKPLQVGVFLDIPRNCVSFYSQMDTETCLHTFEINVANTVYPTFWIFGMDVGGSLTINEIKKC